MSRPAARQVPVLNAANLVTAARLVLVPVFVALVIVSGLTHPGWQIAACAVFLVASLTDLLDGWIARRYGLVTAFGKVADPIVDKALIGAALVLLSVYGALPWWVTGVILVREVGVTALRFWVIRRKGAVGRGEASLGAQNRVIAASHGGKIKTALQITAIAWYLAPLAAVSELLASAGPWLMGAALLVTVATGVDYTVRALHLRRKG